jgi:hypothetical protein
VKRRKIKKIVITSDYGDIRKLYRGVAARSKNFDSLREAVVRAIYGGEWRISPEQCLRNEEEVVLNILEVIAEEADVILSIIPLRKMVPVLSRKFELKEEFQRKQEERFQWELPPSALRAKNKTRRSSLL